MTTDDIDTSRTLEIPVDRRWQVLPLLGGALSAAFGWYFTFGPGAAGASSAAFGIAAVLFGFGVVSLAASLWRAISQRGPAIILSPAGFLDIQISPDVLPWPAIAQVREGTGSGENYIALQLRDGVEKSIRLRPAARLARKVFAEHLEPDEIIFLAKGARVSHDELFAAISAYALAHGG